MSKNYSLLARLVSCTSISPEHDEMLRVNPAYNEVKEALEKELSKLRENENIAPAAVVALDEAIYDLVATVEDASIAFGVSLAAVFQNPPQTAGEFVEFFKFFKAAQARQE